MRMGGLGGLLGGGRGGRSGSPTMRIVLGLIIAVVSFGAYYCSTQPNPLTGEQQRLSLTVDQEVALGAQAAQQMVPQFGGVSVDARGKTRVRQVGQKLLRAMEEIHGKSAEEVGYRFDFTLLEDDKIVNAFALPGGQTFITEALYEQLDDDELAAVMGHEMAHVIQRHGNEQMAKAKLANGLTMAATIAKGDMSGGVMAQFMADLINKGYSRSAEHESDTWGVFYMTAAGYDPDGMIELLEVLQKSNPGRAPPKYFSTHPPTPERIEATKALIERIKREGLEKVIDETVQN